MIIFGNENDSSARWWYEFYFHKNVWVFGVQIVFRWDDIYAISILCFTFQLTKNEWLYQKADQ